MTAEHCDIRLAMRRRRGHSEAMSDRTMMQLIVANRVGRLQTMSRSFCCSCGGKLVVGPYRPMCLRLGVLGHMGVSRSPSLQQLSFPPAVVLQFSENLNFLDLRTR